jgi:hypothetical protein
VVNIGEFGEQELLDCMMVALEFCSERRRDRVQFVDAIRLGVPDSAIASAISLLSCPPGRKPDENLVALSAWFNGLGFEDRRNVEQIIQLTARAAVVGMLCMLDSARALEDGPIKGTLKRRRWSMG